MQRSKCAAARNDFLCNWSSKLTLEKFTAFTAVAQADGNVDGVCFKRQKYLLRIHWHGSFNCVTI
jgi:hypothetical protein